MSLRSLTPRARRRARHRCVTWAASTALAAGALVAGAGAAVAAPEDADATGVVTDAVGAPLAHIAVSAYAAAPDGTYVGNPVADATTDATGRYTFTNLDAASLADGPNAGVARFKLLVVDGNDYSADYSALGYEPSWLAGAPTARRSALLMILPDATAPVSVASTALRRYAGIRVTVVGPDGAPVGYGYAQSFDADDEPGDTYRSTDDDLVDDDPATPEPVADGVVLLKRLSGGESYSVRAGGSTYRAATGTVTQFLTSFTGGGTTFAEAVAVPVVSGQYTSVTARLTDQLTATRAPRITGNASFGSTLSVSTGTWSRQAGTTYTYEWLRGASVVATTPTYLVTVADKKQQLRAVVTAHHLDFTGAATTATTAKVGEGSRVRVSKGRNGTLVVTVTGASKKARKMGTPSGKVVVLDATGTPVSKARKLKKGIATLRPGSTATGPLTVAYLGGKKLGPDTVAVTSGKSGKAKGKGGKGKKKG